jgi:hypothetical protein
VAAISAMRAAAVPAAFSSLGSAELCALYSWPRTGILVLGLWKKIGAFCSHALRAFLFFENVDIIFLRVG